MKFIAIASLISTISAVQISSPSKNLPKWDAAPVFEMNATLSQKSEPSHAAPKAAKQAGGGAVEKGPEPPLTKVYQEVDMSSKCSKGVCHVKECFDGKCKTYEKKQPPKFEFQQPDTHWGAKTASQAAPAAAPAAASAAASKAPKVEAAPESSPKTKADLPPTGASASDSGAAETPHLTVPESGTPSSAGSNGAFAQNGNLKAINSLIKEVKNRPPTEANKLLLDGLVDDTMIDMDIYSGKKTKEAADILKNKEFVVVKSSEIEQEMVQTNSVLNNIEKLLAKKS